MRVADNWTDLTDGVLHHGIIIDELGNVQLNQEVWSNTTSSGAQNSSANDDHCTDWTTNTTNSSWSGLEGSTSYADSGWSYKGNSNNDTCDSVSRLICVEQ